jgi:type I restriction enzyme S subunit
LTRYSTNIPEHWEISKVKYLAKINQKTLTDNTPEEYELNYLDISSVDSDGKVLHVEPMLFKNAPSRARRIVSDGDTLVSTVRTYLKAITWFEKADLNLICSTGFAVLTPKKTIEPKYLSYSMRSSLYIEEIVTRSVGVSYPAITATEIGRLEYLLPPLDEQGIIIEYIDKQTLKVENLILDVNRQIQKLKEYRQSLIYEAVTGKFDVREYDQTKQEVLHG